MAPKVAKESRTKARVEKHLPEEALKNAVEELNVKLQAKEQERLAAEEARSYAQLERDKIDSFWSISKEEVKELRAQLYGKDRDAEELESRHRIEIKVYKQKVKHMLYDHQNDINALKLQVAAATKEATEICRAELEVLKGDKTALQTQLQQQALDNEEALSKVQLEHASTVSALKSEAIERHTHQAACFDAELERMRREEEARRTQEVHAVEDAMKEQIQELGNKHDKAYEVSRSFFNAALAEKLDLVAKLREDVRSAKEVQAAAQALAAKMAEENKKLAEPFTLAQHELADFRLKVQKLEDVKDQLRVCQARLSAAKREVKDLEWKNEILEQKVDSLEARQARVQPIIDNKIIKHLAVGTS